MGTQPEQCPGSGHQKQTSGDGGYQNEPDSNNSDVPKWAKKQCKRTNYTIERFETGIVFAQTGL